MNSCVFTGSFDPFTIGHLEVVKKAGKVFDKVYIAVLKNEFKSTMFSVEQRLKLIEEAIKELDFATAISFNGLAVEAARELGANALVRGIRNGNDIDYEREMAFANSCIDEGIETLFFMSNLPQISSTIVRELIKFGGRLDDVLTGSQIDLLNNF